MRELFAAQLAIAPDDYLVSHSRSDAAILRQISVLRRYTQYVRGRVLDWGCRHAPDSCMLRTMFGDELELFGCDFSTPGDWRAFHEYAGLRYTQLDHAYRIPYDDDQFDLVVGGGVLEHVPNDYESLKEIYRILKVGGVFVISFLPNCYSYTEFLGRHLGRAHHMRRYNLSEVKKRLLHAGFEVLHAGYHQMVPSLAGSGGHCSGAGPDPSKNASANELSSRPTAAAHALGALWKLNAWLEWLWPVRMLSSNLYVISRKRQSM